MRLLQKVSSGSNPAGIFGGSLRAWFNSQNVTLNAGNVSQATNLVAGNGNAVQATALQQPALEAAAINGYPAISHDTAAKNLVAAQAGITGNVYSAMVINIPSYTAINGRVLSYRNGVNNDFSNANGIATILRDASTSKLFAWYNSGVAGLGSSYPDITAGAAYFTLETLCDDTNNVVNHYVNGTLVYNPAWSGTLNSDSINIGDGQTANSTSFKWPEFILNIGSPTAAQRANLLSYFRRKYAHY